MLNKGASFLIFAESMVISPEMSDKGNERILVVLFIPRYFKFISFCFKEESELNPSSYFSPKILFFIETKGKRGSLPFVLLVIVQRPELFINIIYVPFSW